jgi:hypothetical protein
MRGKCCSATSQRSSLVTLAPAARGLARLRWRRRSSARAQRSVVARADQPVAIAWRRIAARRGRVGIDHVRVAADDAHQLGEDDAYWVSLAGARPTVWLRGLAVGVRRGVSAGGLIVDVDRPGNDPGGRRVIGLDREGGVHVVVTFTSADHHVGRPSVFRGRLFRRRDEVRAVTGPASGRPVGYQSMLRSLGIIVRLTRPSNASVPFGLGFNSAA